MNAERWRQVDQIFNDALKREPNERQAFLDRECAGNVSLREEIEILIRSHDAAGSFMETGVSASSGALAGQTIGPYQIRILIGAGGMGEVYKGWDARLKRDVAIKILPDIFSRDPDRVSRFQREAEVLASLNHPNIAAIYDVEKTGNATFLVLELVDGETLADRIARGPIPIDEAVTISKSICEALEAAHEKGVIHRDLKPANVKITPDGKVKVLDFGLAKAFSKDPVRSDPSESPTLSAAATLPETILGTAAYMAPEQARGKKVDERADIWAFGCVLFEMLTGKQVFPGEDVTEIIAGVLKSEPDWSALPAGTPANIRFVLRRCLEKDPKRRLHSAADARIQMEETTSAPQATSVSGNATASRPHWKQILVWGFMGLAACILTGFVVWKARPSPPEPPPVEFWILPPDKTVFLPQGATNGAAPYPTASPNGRHIAFLAGTNPTDRIWIRSIDSLETRALPGTEGANLPFWSPDSRYIGFFRDGKLNKVDYSGGPVQVLCDAPAPEGGTWNSDGVILFAPNRGAAGLRRVWAAGGESTAVTIAAPVTPHSWPYFLPDGRHFLFLAQQPGTIYVASLDSKETKRLLNADSRAVYAPPGYLLFIRQGTLMGQSFDVKNLELSGEPFRIAENVRYNVTSGRAAFSVSDTGLLTYRLGGSSSRVVSFDRSGRQLEPINQTGDSRAPRLSPDETRIAVERQEGGQSDIWTIDLARGTNSRLTFDPRNETEPIWSPDGTYVVYAVETNGKKDLYRKRVNGSGSEELLLKTDQDLVPTAWSQDGKFVLFRTRLENKPYSIWALPMTGDLKPAPIVESPGSANAAQFSPDGKWIAYWSAESAIAQTFVQPFPPTGEKVQVSVDGGIQPMWRGDGKELFFVALDDRLMSVDVELGSKFHAGLPKPLFAIPGYSNAGGSGRYSVSRDGKRFLMSVGNALTDTPITAIVNWKPKP